MGKITGFMEHERIEEGYKPIPERVKHYKEFVVGLTPAQAKVQGARCMDCGTPFCNSGCPVNNIIPDFNDLVYRDDWQSAFAVLDSTNNFPEFTGRICPAPCEAACVLNVNDDPVGIKSIEHAIINRAWDEGWVTPRPARHKTGKKVAVVGSGPAGMAAAQQLARAGHDVTLFEKNDRIGGLLRYGIPDFKMEKTHIDRRVEQMKAEGVVFRTGVVVGSAKDRWARAPRSPTGPRKPSRPSSSTRNSTPWCSPAAPSSRATCRCPAATWTASTSRWSSCRSRTRSTPATRSRARSRADGKHVIVIGGGDTGSDCVGTSNRHGAVSVTQFELLPQPPDRGEPPR